MTYIVMECHKGYVILLDENGLFVKAADLHYQVGQTITDPVLMQNKRSSPRIAWRIVAPLAAIAACFLLFFGFGILQHNRNVYTSIYLAINPQVQMDLDRDGTVVGLTGINEDGRTLLDGYDGNGKDKIIVADELIDRAIDMGFLSEGGEISFSIDTPDIVLFQEYGIELRTNVTQHLDGRITVTIAITDCHQTEGENTLSSALSQAISPTPNRTQSPGSSAPIASIPPEGQEYQEDENEDKDEDDDDDENDD
ncbi:MAG TPA: hypothetical protein H9691_09040 [Firmicutes bacterium]|nr:hypothetical protein [Bacillota bacterium]